MAKSYIPLTFRKKTYKLTTSDIARVFKIQKRKTPSLPPFFESQKYLPETDIDN